MEHFPFSCVPTAFPTVLLQVLQNIVKGSACLVCHFLSLECLFAVGNNTFSRPLDCTLGLHFVKINALAFLLEVVNVLNFSQIRATDPDR